MGFQLRRLNSDTSAKRKPVEIYNPYLAARKEWDERYGEFITRARNWRTVALISGLVALLATGGLVWLTARSHVIPFVVFIDSLGRPVASALAEQTYVGDDRLRRAVIQRAIDRVYAHIASGTSAQAFISEFYRNDPPFKRAQTDTVSVEVKSVLPTSDRTFEVDWIETARDLYGNVKSSDHWKGSFTIALNAPTEERQARVNPLGVYVTAASWAKVL